jgi:hypothetical protein
MSTSSPDARRENQKQDGQRWRHEAGCAVPLKARARGSRPCSERWVGDGTQQFAFPPLLRQFQTHRHNPELCDTYWSRVPFKDPNSPGAKASNKRRFARWYAKNRAHCLARMKERYRNKKAVSKQENDGRKQMKKGAKKDEATRQKMRDGSARAKP